MSVVMHHPSQRSREDVARTGEGGEEGALPSMVENFGRELHRTFFVKGALFTVSGQYDRAVGFP